MYNIAREMNTPGKTFHQGSVLTGEPFTGAPVKVLCSYMHAFEFADNFGC